MHPIWRRLRRGGADGARGRGVRPAGHGHALGCAWACSITRTAGPRIFGLAVLCGSCLANFLGCVLLVLGSDAASLRARGGRRTLANRCAPAPPSARPADGSGMRHLNCAFTGPGLKPLSNGHASDEARALQRRPAAALPCRCHAAALQHRSTLPSMLWRGGLTSGAERIALSAWCLCLCLTAPGRAAALLQAAFANLFMNGQEVFKFAVRAVPTVRPPRRPPLRLPPRCPAAAACARRWSRRLAAAVGTECCRLFTAPASLPGACSGRHMPSQMPPLPSCSPGRQVIEAALADAGMQREQIDWLVMHQVAACSQLNCSVVFQWAGLLRRADGLCTPGAHPSLHPPPPFCLPQANMRIMSAAADRLGVPPGDPRCSRLRTGLLASAMAYQHAPLRPAGRRPHPCDHASPSSLQPTKRKATTAEIIHHLNSINLAFSSLPGCRARGDQPEPVRQHQRGLHPARAGRGGAARRHQAGRGKWAQRGAMAAAYAPLRGPRLAGLRGGLRGCTPGSGRRAAVTGALQSSLPGLLINPNPPPSRCRCWPWLDLAPASPGRPPSCAGAEWK